MATTPGRKLRVFVGGPRTILSEPGSWVEYAYAEIGPEGRERIDGTVFVPKIGWRLTDTRMFGELGFEGGEDLSRIYNALNGNATLAVYADDGSSIDDAANPLYNQRWFQELGVPQGSQTTQGDPFVRKNAQQLGGLGSDWSAFPPPVVDEPVPLDRCLIGHDQLDADDKIHVGFKLLGSGSQNRGPVFRFFFSALAGHSKNDLDEGTVGTGQMGVVLSADGSGRLFEVIVPALPPEGPTTLQWRQRKAFMWCEKSRVFGNYHGIFVETDAQRDGNGKLYGKRVRLSFTTLAAWGPAFGAAFLVESLVQAGDQVGSLGGAVYYDVPNPSVLRQPTQSPLRIDARRDTSVEFQALRTVFRESGVLTVKTAALNQAPNGGVIHVQVYGSFPTGTSANLRLFDADTNTECAVHTVLPSDVAARCVDFEPVQGARNYLLKVEMHASSDRLKSPTVKRVRFVREATHSHVIEEEVELTSIVRYTSTGGGADPSSSTMGLVCWDRTGEENAILRQKSGMRVRAELDLGPDPTNPGGPNLKTVVFRGTVAEAKRKRVAGKGKQGFNQTGPDLRTGPLCRYHVKCVGEWHNLSKHLAPGRIDLAFDGAIGGIDASKPQAHKVTDIVRFLLIEAVGKARVDVPDLPQRLPLDQDLQTFLEKYQSTVPICVTLLRDYCGAFLYKDENASYPEGHPNGTTDEGMWRVKKGQKRSELKIVGQFCEGPIVAGASPVHPGAYPDGSAIEGTDDESTTRPVPRTFMRLGTTEEWIEPPSCNQIIAVGVGKAQGLIVNATGLIKRVYNNFVAASFPKEAGRPAQGEDGGPPQFDASHPDYTTGEVITAYFSDPMWTTETAVEFVGRRLFDRLCHAKFWLRGESPLLLIKKETTLDDLQINPRPLLFADVVVWGSDSYIMASEPSILIEGEQGGSAFSAAYNEMYRAPHEDTYLHAYGETWVGHA